MTQTEGAEMTVQAENAIDKVGKRCYQARISRFLGADFNACRLTLLRFRHAVQDYCLQE